LKIDPHVVAQKRLRESIIDREGLSNPAVRNIPIKITTIPSSKGLADDYVFISDFDDHLFLDEGQKCSDQRVYDFIVALTRARRKVFLMSSQKAVTKFMTWIAQERVAQIDL
jgi:superfamily I DNA/RNA helicase